MFEFIYQAETFAKLPEKPLYKESTSFPRRRESIFEYGNLLNKISFLNFKMDSRLRGMTAVWFFIGGA
ncbi:hypothetical protein [Neisseria weixii]|uniref:hypothetical protein n=1 Tax=Neisseria weixii TaxID=1853276 RepID=UPI000BB7B129|nr:hypothetical protein [Neisseria weixii]ATD65310.1 hypothetical protein CGZ65_08405 [Neisseria weixii]